ncbi:MAG: DUF1211 domain-containing protein [Solirubrobacterales bacterium]|nr:DUF1211 domain-containing protein [Solirubrobacterales bacterium]HMT04828.1 TMEM175 family protein [Solirubrobacterales bacterium]
MKSRLRYERGSIEFNRVVTLTDGIYAIAMTLLVLTIGIPRVDPDGLLDELKAIDGDILTYVISIAILGYFWISNHRFVRHLASMDPTYAGLNVICLALVAFLPLPTALLDRYSTEPVTVVLYLSILLLISLMEVALFAWAHHRRLFTADPSARAVRYGVLIALLPVLVFITAIPIGLLSSSTVSLALWILICFPIRIYLDRQLGPGSDYL